MEKRQFLFGNKTYFDIIKKAALIELYRHSEVLRTLAQLLTDQGWELELLTHARVREDLYELESLPGIRWHLQEQQTKSAFLKRLRELLEECQVVIFVTLVSDLSFFSRFKLRTKTILVIHNGNTFLAPFRNLTFPAKPGDWARLIRLFFYEARHLRRVLDKFDFLSLAAPSLHQYFSEQHPELQKRYRFIDPLPFSFFGGLPPDALQEKTAVEIAIPGTVQGEGRDYESVLNAFRELVPSLKSPVKLHLLGSSQSAYARKFVRAFQKLAGVNFQLTYATEVIPQKEFDERLKKADFLILPLKKSYSLGGIREYYGHTNISGGINDLIRFGIPALLTPYYPLDPVLEQLCVRYNSVADLKNLLKQWIGEKTYLELRKKTPEILADYRREILGKQLDTQINRLLSQ